MKHFGWKKWEQQLNRISHLKHKPIERTGLRYLHRKSSLNEISLRVSKNLSKFRSGSFAVHTESIWIDGTPQAYATLHSSHTVQCELSDLLFIISERDLTGRILSERGVLLQGKTSGKYNKIQGGGKSTKKERNLLEKIDRAKEIRIFAGYDIKKTHEIGKYIIPGIKTGLSDCSRYLIISKNNMWQTRHSQPKAPFQIGWPVSGKSSWLKSPKNFLDAIDDMTHKTNIGREIIHPKLCQWSKLVYDLRQEYRPATMSGYGGQNRINESRSVLFLFEESLDEMIKEESYYNFIENPPGKILSQKEKIPPYISIINVVITNLSEHPEIQD